MTITEDYNDLLGLCEAAIHKGLEPSKDHVAFINGNEYYMRGGKLHRARIKSPLKGKYRPGKPDGRSLREFLEIVHQIGPREGWKITMGPKYIREAKDKPSKKYDCAYCRKEGNHGVTAQKCYMWAEGRVVVCACEKHDKKACAHQQKHDKGLPVWTLKDGRRT